MRRLVLPLLLAVATPAFATATGDAVAPDSLDADEGLDSAEPPPAVDSELPKHPLTDTRGLSEERAQLKADSDAELDRRLGLNDAGQEPDGLGFQLFKTFLVLGIVVGLIYLSLNFGLRKLMGVRAVGAFGKGTVVHVVERVTLEPKRSLYVLRAAGEYLLVSSSEAGMSLVSKLDSAEVDRIQREKGSATGMPQLSPFLQKLLTRKGGPPPQA